MPGFARLRLRAGDVGAWAEFIGSDGRLRRDLVKARVATLLAAALKRGECDLLLTATGFGVVRCLKV